MTWSNWSFVTAALLLLELLAGFVEEILLFLAKFEAVGALSLLKSVGTTSDS